MLNSEDQRTAWRDSRRLRRVYLVKAHVASLPTSPGRVSLPASWPAQLLKAESLRPIRGSLNRSVRTVPSPVSSYRSLAHAVGHLLDQIPQRMAARGLPRCRFSVRSAPGCSLNPARPPSHHSSPFGRRCFSLHMTVQSHASAREVSAPCASVPNPFPRTPRRAAQRCIAEERLQWHTEGQLRGIDSRELFQPPPRVTIATRMASVDSPRNTVAWPSSTLSFCQLCWTSPLI